MRAILIDPHLKEVREITLNEKESKLKQMYPLFSKNCSTAERLSWIKGYEVWVDEEGLLKDNKFFRLTFTMDNGKEMTQDLAGVGIVTGKNLSKLRDTITIDTIKEKVQWQR